MATPTYEELAAQLAAVQKEVAASRATPTAPVTTPAKQETKPEITGSAPIDAATKSRLDAAEAELTTLANANAEKLPASLREKLGTDLVGHARYQRVGELSKLHAEIAASVKADNEAALKAAAGAGGATGAASAAANPAAGAGSVNVGGKVLGIADIDKMNLQEINAGIAALRAVRPS